MAKTGRNDQCHCGSGRKYKKCCETKERTGAVHNRFLLVAVGGVVLAAIVIGIASFTSKPSGNNVRIWDSVHGHYHNANGVQVP